VSFATITLCVASQQVFIIVVYFVINSASLLVYPSAYGSGSLNKQICVKFGVKVMILHIILKSCLINLSTMVRKNKSTPVPKHQAMKRHGGKVLYILNFSARCIKQE
jgi:hypothetical protein